MSLPPINSIVLNGSVDQIALYRPLRMIVTNVTNARYAVITTAIDHEYSAGEKVRLLVPVIYGMRIDEVVTILQVPTPNTLVVNLNTLGLDAFSPPLFPGNFAQLIPVQGVCDNTYDNQPVNPTVFITSLC